MCWSCILGASHSISGYDMVYLPAMQAPRLPAGLKSTNDKKMHERHFINCHAGNGPASSRVGQDCTVAARKGLGPGMRRMPLGLCSALSHRSG